MNTGLVTQNHRMAPCYPGADLWVVGADSELDEARCVSTSGWHPLAWGRELLRLDVTELLCVGIDRFLWGALNGYGIRVVPNAIGTAQDVLELWRRGELQVPAMWVPGSGRRQRGRGRGRRHRGGRPV